MIQSEIGELSGKKLIFFQCVNEEESKKARLPKGVYYYWELDGKRIDNPGDVVALVVHEASAGNLKPTSFIQNKAVEEHYKKLKATQMASVQKHMQSTREYYEKMKGGMDAKTYAMLMKELDKTQELYKDEFPDIDGAYRASRKVADEILGKDFIDKNFTEAQKIQTFGES